GGRRREVPSWPTGSGARGTSRVGVCTERAQLASTGRAPSGVGHERLRPRRGGPRSRRHRARARRAIGRGRMDTIVIRGGAELEGEVVVSGSKNAALPLLFATLLTRERSVVRNVPALADVRTTIQVLEHLGARVTQSADGHEVAVEPGAVALAEGTTVLENAAREPENICLAHALARMGAGVRGAGTSEVTIEGCPELGGGEHAVIPDRIEAGTFMVAAAVTGGAVQVTGAPADHLEAFLAKLGEAGVAVRERESGIRVEGNGKLAAVDVKTMPYPGFPTDLQAQFMTLMTRASGTSTLTETIFENRFLHAQELVRMGADIHVDGNHAIVRGPQSLSGAPVMATDLRASVCLVLAGLAARGTTRVSRVYHLDRGYEQVEAKLSALGADIAREKAAV